MKINVNDIYIYNPYFCEWIVVESANQESLCLFTVT